MVGGGARSRGGGGLPAGQKADSQRRTGKVYEGAFESVFAILIGGGFGFWADKYFETAPGFLLLGLAIGFGAFVLRLWKLGVALQKIADGETDNETGDRSDDP